MKTQLKLLPVELEDTYLKMFRKINALPQTTRDLAQVCFLWAFNAKEVLDSGTFVDAVSLAHKNDSQQKTPYNAHVIEEVTFGLLTVSIIVFKRVRPIHFSLQEFVIHPRRSHPPDLQNFLPDAENANAKLAILCIQHLILDVEAQDTFFTCLIYCGKNFDSHILSITTTIPADLWAILDRIFLTEPELMKRLLRWKFPSQSFNYPNHVCIGNPKEISPAMFMRVTSLHKIPAIWNRYKDAGQTPQDYPRDYLFLAALLRMNDIVKDIISQGIYINTATMDRHTALHYAIWDPLEGRDETDFSTMQILLDAGADWNFDARHVPCGHPREDYLSPINLALSHPDHYAAVQPMVKHHSFNFATYMKTIPVDGADKIRVLIERGADINQRDEYGDTALQIAREDGRQDCVEILKDLGALE